MRVTTGRLQPVWRRPRRRGAGVGQLALFGQGKPPADGAADDPPAPAERPAVPIGPECDGLQICGLSLTPRRGWSARLRSQNGEEFGCEGPTAGEALRGAYLLAMPVTDITRQDCTKAAGVFLNVVGDSPALKVLRDELRFLRWAMRL